jgi:hypothetical protein
MRDTEKFTQDDWQAATVEELLRGYQEMAADEEREKKAFQWSEASICDSCD